MTALLSFGLRAIFGAIAGCLKMPPFILGALARGKAPPAYSADGIELGAAVLRHTVSRDLSSGGADDFEDLAISSADGTRLHAVVDSGTHRLKGKRPIVFVHGFPELWVSWHKQLERFASAGHPVLALSMRGYGMSDKPAGLEKYDLSRCLVEDVRAAVSHAAAMGDGLAPLLVAHDWGAGVSWHYVCQDRTVSSGEVAGYVSLSNPPAEGFKANMNPTLAWASLYMLFFNMPVLPELVLLANRAWLVGLLMGDCSRATLPAWLVNTYRTNALQDGSMTAQLNYYRSIIQRPPKPETGFYGTKGNRLTTPVLMVRGKGDAALKAGLFKGYDRFLASATLVELDDCSHWIQADCPREVNDEIENFMEKLGQG